MRLLLGHEPAEPTDQVQHSESSETKGSIYASVGKALERINYDEMSAAAAGVDPFDTHQLRHLTGSDVDGGAGHEGANRRQRNEFDNPAKSNESEKGDDGPGKEG